VGWKAVSGSLAIALFFPAVLFAGQLYGSVIFRGTGVPGAAIEINCGGSVTPGVTVAGGAYRVNVQQQGQCSFSLPGYAGRPSAVVFSNPNPSAYSFELIEVAGGRSYELRRR
jgi:hypothetical protein